ncbi:MAG: hypothetical protein KBC41_04245 [Candidatus Pacebacteria bacterium]|nr:hypothetical protein [Candidatus Paceibacterota bacterium]MBP9867254.1 hypothetical protein [Candidatus Paceibacterota bacterium]
MHDIRKPYTRSSSNRDLNSRVEQFESRSYERDTYVDQRDQGPVQIPTKRVRRNLNDMDMYPKRRMDDIRENSDETFEQDLYEEDDTHSRNTKRKIRKESSLGTWIFILVVVVISVSAGLLTYVFDSATVTIVPKYKDVDINKTISFSQKPTKDTVIPFVVETSSLTKSKTLSLSESKKIEAKASGKVVIYNNHDESPQKLIKNTRLESHTGKIYRINQSVTVPGKDGDTPGSIEVTVYADGYGTEYNSAETDFTIPGFKGTPREKSFYARSKGTITGGSSGNVSMASLSDLNAAKDELALELAQEIKSTLMKVKKDEYVGLYSAIEVVYKDNETEVLNGTTGVYEVTATGYLMLANEEKLASTIATDSIGYENEKVRLGYQESLVYTRKDTDHVSSTTELSILTQGKPRIITVSDVDGIRESVKGKKRSEFKPIMKNINTVIGAEISFSPLWLSSFPNEIKKIEVIESLPKR